MPTKKGNSAAKKERTTTITFNVSVDNKKALKLYAVEHETTISALLTKWIEENCKGAKKNG